MNNGVAEKGPTSHERTDGATNGNHSSHVCFYDRHSLEEIDWPDTEDGRYARAYFEPMMLQGIQRFISNVETTLLLARIDDLVLPVTVNEAEYDNAYICSPYTHYVRYAKQELTLLRKPLLEKGLSALLSVLGWGMRKSKINKVVHVKKLAVINEPLSGHVR